MNKIIFSIIIFLIGIASGYCFIVFAGYTSYWTVDIMIFIVKTLKSHDLLDIASFVLGIKELILLLLTAIPIYLIFGLLLTYFIKQDIKLVKWFSSIGLVIFLLWAHAIAALCSEMFSSAITILAVPLFVNLFFINKISNRLDTPNKNEETNTNPQAD